MENALSAWANKFENESPKLHNEIIQNSRKEIDKQIREHNQLKTEELSNLKQTLSTENVPGDGFPNSLCMYNIGIKSHKIQNTTVETVKHLNNMQDELNDIVQSTAIDKRMKEELKDPTTTFYLHKNLMKMRALYHKGYNGHTIEQNMPQVFEENAPEKRNFADRYTKLQEETMHKKEIEQI